MESLLETPPSFAKFRARHPCRKVHCPFRLATPFFLSLALYEEKKDQIFVFFFSKILGTNPRGNSSLSITRNFFPRSFFLEIIKSNIVSYKQTVNLFGIFSTKPLWATRREMMFSLRVWHRLDHLFVVSFFSWFSVRSVGFFFLF